MQSDPGFANGHVRMTFFASGVVKCMEQDPAIYYKWLVW